MPSIRYSNVDLDKITVQPPKKETSQAMGKSYKKAQYRYQFDKGENKLQIELCKVKFSRIRKSKKDNPDKYDSYYVFAEFDRSEPVMPTEPNPGCSEEERKDYEEKLAEYKQQYANYQGVVDCLKFLDDFHVKLGNLHVPHRGKNDNQYDKFFKPTTPVELDQSGFKALVNYDTDPISGDRVPEKNPTKSYNLLYGTNRDTGEHYEARFKYPDGTPIDWEILENANFEGYPVISYTNSFYGGGDITTQSRLISVVVTKVKEIEFNDNQQETINDLTGENPNVAKEVMEQANAIASLIAKRRGNKPKDTNLAASQIIGQTPLSDEQSSLNAQPQNLPPANTQSEVHQNTGMVQFPDTSQITNQPTSQTPSPPAEQINYDAVPQNQNIQLPTTQAPNNINEFMNAQYQQPAQMQQQPPQMQQPPQFSIPTMNQQFPNIDNIKP